MAVSQICRCLFVIFVLFFVSGCGPVSALGSIQPATQFFLAENLAWHSYCGEERASVERNLRNLVFEDLLQLATNLIVDSCHTRNRQAVLSGSQKPRKVVSRSFDRISGENHTSSSGIYESVFQPLQQSSVIATVMVDVDNKTFAALQQIYADNCGPACRTTFGCFPPHGVVRPVCNNTYFGNATSPCDENGNLVYLGLSKCNLVGTMSSAFGELGSLTSLYANENYLVGSIPDALSILVQLQQLHLYTNRLTDNIPNGLSVLTRLQQLDLGANSLFSLAAFRMDSAC
eukprot:TRINITY_DN7417_c0_g1_i5.p1 TRINITY_DN7417_c0_g1~~TRINITY_DN7417_c0_g1_i5.p1  ORF type:complete len:301 (+),score=34.45 TRINITY_DN7417_c0_g1_i5:41-904(+)